MARRADLGLAAVARRAGVSTATVSNVLNRPEIVAEATRQRVLAAIRELDFAPNRAAAALRQGWARLIGLVIPDVVNPFYASIVDAVVAAADRDNYAVTLCVSHDDPERELRHFDLLAEHRAAGALVVPIAADESRLALLRRIGTRVVLVDRHVDEATACSVAVDDVRGGELAVDHLLLRPGEGITLVTGPPGVPQCADRRAGALRQLAAVGRSGDALVEVVEPQMSIEQGILAGRRIAREGLPRRVFCINDQLAVGVIRGLAAEGISVPSDAAVVGYGDLALATEEAVRLTTVGQPKEMLGSAAVEKLLAELREGPEHRHSSTVFTPELVVRGSATLPGATAGD